MICKDIFFRTRYSRVYPFISFMSSNFFIDVLHFILTYPSFYPIISNHILFFYPYLYSYISSSYPTFLSFCILLFYPFYPVIYPAGYSIRFSTDPARRGVLPNRTLFLHVLLSNRVSHCVFISQPPDAAAAGSRCWRRRLRVRRRSGTGSRCCRRRRRVSAAAMASAGAGRGEGGGGERG
jgi:hypothetical protein